MATRLEIYNNALYMVGERRLSNLYEDREPRYVMDNIYTLDVVASHLELCQPRFAVSSAKLADPTTSSVHGLDQVYSLPYDFVCPLRDIGTHGKLGFAFLDEELEQPLNRYMIEGSTIATEQATNVYVRYIRNSVNEAQFTPLFTRVIVAYLAMMAAPRINPSKMEFCEEQYNKALDRCLAAESVKENDFLIQSQGAISADQLEVYNLVMAHLGKPELRSINDESEHRLAIDAVYAQAEAYMFESVKPRFATQTVELSGGSTSGVHGLDNVFDLPADYQDFVDLWADEDLEDQIYQYILEDDTIAVANYDTAYLRYITNAHVEANWTPSFKHAVAAYIAWILSPRFAAEQRDSIKAVLAESVTTAVENDGLRERDPRTQLASGSLSADQLTIYNIVAGYLGKPELRYVDDESELRLAIDNIYALSRNYILEEVKPRFATQTLELGSGSTSAVHGLDNVFTLPSDYIDFVDLWADADLENQIQQYILEDGTIAIQNYATAYLRYITDAHVEANWSPSFTHAVACHIAWMLAPRFKPEKIADLTEMSKQTLVSATENDGARERNPRTQGISGDLSTDQLALYNQIAARLGQPELRFVADESELRLAIDNVYAGCRDYLIEQIAPLFATKTAILNSGSPSAVHGYDNVFDLPADYSGLLGVWTDEDMDEPVHRFFIEEGTIAVADHSTVYIRYSANAADEADWTPSFNRAMAAYVAWTLAPRFIPVEPPEPGKPRTSANTLSGYKAQYEDAVEKAIQIDQGREPSLRPLPGTVALSDSYRALYNRVLEILDLRPIISNDDESERKVAIDYAIDNGAVTTVFELITWDYPTVTVKIDYDDPYTAPFGYKFRFEIPDDWIRTDAIAGDENFSVPLKDYKMEGGYFHAHVDTLYLRYQSSDFLTTLSSWPNYMTNLVAAEIARRCTHLSGVSKGEVEAKYEELKDEAYNTDAQRRPPQRIRTGSWVRSRFQYETRDRRRP